MRLVALVKRKLSIPIALAALIATTAVAGAAGPPMHPSASRLVPAVSGEKLVTAYAALHRDGLRVTFRHAFSVDWSGECIPLVTSSTPTPGRSVPADFTVVLRTTTPPCALASPAHPVHLTGPYRVPSFAGRRLSLAIRWVDAHGLLWAATIPGLHGGGAGSLYANYVIRAQKPRPGYELTLGIRTPGGGWQPTPLQLQVTAR